MATGRRGIHSPEPSGDELRIGLVSDTHEAADPVGLVEQLQAWRCDLNVHLGDVGGSRAVALAVREFKRTLGSLEALNEQQRQCFHDRVKQGIRPMRAYSEVVLGIDSAIQGEHRNETRKVYEGVFRSMGGLTNAYCLAGNVDKAMFQAGIIDVSHQPDNVTLVTRPIWVDQGDRAVVFWPSMRLKDPGSQEELADLATDFARRGRDKRQVIVLGHEQLFKGPPPRVYKQRTLARGLDSITVPWFEPNPSWRCLISLFRQLPSETEVGYVFGHIHDAQDVIAAGFPALRGADASRLWYRIYGLSHQLFPGDRGLNRRRRLAMFYVPIERVGVLTLGTTGLGWEVCPND